MRLEDLPDEICAWCGAGFETTRWWKKYCCYECRKASRAAFLKQERRSVWAKLKCQRCGGPIKGAIKSSTRYCSGKCQNAARADRDHGRVADLRCVDCDEPIPDAGRRDQKLCLACARERHRRKNRERARKKREAERTSLD